MRCRRFQRPSPTLQVHPSTASLCARACARTHALVHICVHVCACTQVCTYAIVWCTSLPRLPACMQYLPCLHPHASRPPAHPPAPRATLPLPLLDSALTRSPLPCPALSCPAVPCRAVPCLGWYASLACLIRMSHALQTSSTRCSDGSLHLQTPSRFHIYGLYSYGLYG